MAARKHSRGPETNRLRVFRDSGRALATTTSQSRKGGQLTSRKRPARLTGLASSLVGVRGRPQQGWPLPVGRPFAFVTARRPCSRPKAFQFLHLNYQKGQQTKGKNHEHRHDDDHHHDDDDDDSRCVSF